MKKFVIAAALGAISISGFAQDAKPGAGKMMLAGSLGYSRSTPETPKGGSDPDGIGTLTFSPSFGYFLDENIAFGVRLSLQSRMMKDMKGSTAFGIGGFGRYYSSLNDGGNFQMFGEVALGYNSSTAMYPKAGNAPDPTTGLGFGIAPGFGWYPGKKFAVEFTLPSILAFTTSRTNKDSDATAKNFQIGVSTLSQPASLTVLFFMN